MAQVRVMPFNSLSRDHFSLFDLFLNPMFQVTFNSLSRDHLNSMDSRSWRKRGLSTPSLGITSRHEGEINDKIRQTFNSLSRDHESTLLIITSTSLTLLSTPSLGITIIRACRLMLERGSPFNSLSRDHFSLFDLFLNPMFQVTFNSLSRDHQRAGVFRCVWQ